MTGPRARIHALLPTEEHADELDMLLNAFRKDVVEFVLEMVKSACGDVSAEEVQDSSPTLEAWLEGRDVG